MFTRRTRLLEDQLDRADTLEVCKIADRGTAVRWRAELSTVLYAVRDFRVHFVVASSSAGPSTVRFSRPALKTGANMVSRTKRSASSTRSWCLRYSARPGHAVNKLLFSRSQVSAKRARGATATVETQIATAVCPKRWASAPIPLELRLTSGPFDPRARGRRYSRRPPLQTRPPFLSSALELFGHGKHARRR